MASAPADLDAVLALHDDQVARRSVDVWVTASPTFAQHDAVDDSTAKVYDLPPSAGVRALYKAACAAWAAAEDVGLSATRLRFNGDLTDSGGGGQLALGGARPEASPFVRYPHVLPALIRYINNHPALSYWFTGDSVGSASPGARPDEGARERWDELAVTLGWLEQLADRGELPPEQLQHALGPLLVDGGGSSLRAELGIDRLWPPHDRAGLVELRAVRMPERPSMLAATAALFRAIVARLVVSHYRAPLVDWHDELHDRFALPAALSRDLRMVLGDLDEHGLGLPAELRRELEAWRPRGITCRLGDATLELRPALDFWPSLGGAVDASTQRWELSLDGPGPDRIVVAGKWAHLRALGEGVRAVGVRRRVFQCAPATQPGLPSTDPLVIEWAWGGRAQRIELWAWRPLGGPYAGLPKTDLEASERRQERIKIATREGDVSAAGYWREARPFTIDLRRDGIA